MAALLTAGAKMALTIDPTFIDMFRGDLQVFDVTPAGLSGGFNTGGSDVVKFTAVRDWNDATPEIALDSPPPGVTIIDAQTARVAILPADTASFPKELVELHFGVEVIRGTEKYTLLSGTMIVKPVVRQ
jgi:hypothetical protein